MHLEYDEVLAEVAQTVFATMFDIQLERVNTVLEPVAVATAIEIAGATNGMVELTFSTSLISAATSRMLNISLAEITAMDQQEVACELANIIGGNLKSILLGPASLSLPKIVADPNVIPTSEPAHFHAATLDGTEGQVHVKLSLSN